MSFVGCKPETAANKISRVEYLQSLDSTECFDGMIFWTSDTAFEVNSELMLLLDTLYRHVREDDFAIDVRAEERWMSEYRKRLCSYYDDHAFGYDTISVYSKTDSVLNEGAKLLKIGCQGSTMEMIVNNSVELTFDRCRDYSLLSQVIEECENEDVKSLIYQEWALYEQMAGKVGTIASNLVGLKFWGGSIVGPLGSCKLLQVSQTRRDMYQTIDNIIKGVEWDATGAYLKNTERFFFDCCFTSLKKIEDETEEFFNSEDRDRVGMINETIEETENQIRDLRPVMDEWIVVMDKLDEELTHDLNRHDVERAASYMLMKWSSIVTTD